MMSSEKKPDPETDETVPNDFIKFPRSGVALLFCKLFEQFAYFGTRCKDQFLENRWFKLICFYLCF